MWSLWWAALFFDAIHALAFATLCYCTDRAMSKYAHNRQKCLCGDQAAAPCSGRDLESSLRRIFGSEHPVRWLRMTWEPPPGAAAAQTKKGD